MSSNIRSDLLTFETPVNPNYKGLSSIQRKVYPITNITTTGVISGNLEYEFSVPAGYRFDASKSYLAFDVKIQIGAGTALATSAPAYNLPATFFKTARLLINDYQVSVSNNVAQDDTFLKRVLYSNVYNKTVNSASWLYGSDTDRFNAVQANACERLVIWQPTCVLPRDTIIPENNKIRMTFQVDPLLHTAVSSPAFVAKTDNACDGTLYFQGMYFMAYFVKVDAPQPKEIYISTYKVDSIPTNTASENNTFQVRVDPKTYKLGVGVQSTAGTVQDGKAPTIFSSGGGVGAVKNAYSYFLTDVQLRYAGGQYPQNPYSITETIGLATASVKSKSQDAYFDYVSATGGLFDASGSESYKQWSDPAVIGDESYGRLFVFDCVKPDADRSSNVEAYIKFSTAPTTTATWVFGLSKQITGIKYGASGQPEETKSIDY